MRQNRRERLAPLRRPTLPPRRFCRDAEPRARSRATERRPFARCYPAKLEILHCSPASDSGICTRGDLAIRVVRSNRARRQRTQTLPELHSRQPNPRSTCRRTFPARLRPRSIICASPWRRRPCLRSLRSSSTPESPARSPAPPPSALSVQLRPSLAPPSHGHHWLPLVAAARFRPRFALGSSPASVLFGQLVRNGSGWARCRLGAVSAPCFWRRFPRRLGPFPASLRSPLVPLPPLSAP